MGIHLGSAAVPRRPVHPMGSKPSPMATWVALYSGGHSSALVAIEVARAVGPERLVLLNHDINPSVEDADIKRFKQEVAEYLGVPITYANHPTWNTQDQFDVVVQKKAFKVGQGTPLCTNVLKTLPFFKWLKDNFPVTPGQMNPNLVCCYGFDAKEGARAQRRSGVLGPMGYFTSYPLLDWTRRTIQSTEEIGIKPPLTYGVWKHANCIGCLKAGKQHWYAVFCTRPDIWEKAKKAEAIIGNDIIYLGHGVHVGLEELEPEFALMRCKGIQPTEHTAPQKFWAEVRRLVGEVEIDPGDTKPCECSI